MWAVITLGTSCINPDSIWFNHNIFDADNLSKPVHFSHVCDCFRKCYIANSTNMHTLGFSISVAGNAVGSLVGYTVYSLVRVRKTHSTKPVQVYYMDVWYEWSDRSVKKPGTTTAQLCNKPIKTAAESKHSPWPLTPLAEDEGATNDVYGIATMPTRHHCLLQTRSNCPREPSVKFPVFQLPRVWTQAHEMYTTVRNKSQDTRWVDVYLLRAIILPS